MKAGKHRFTEFRITPVAVPDPPLLNCVGVHAPYALRIILEVFTETGLSGISEIPGNHDTELALKELAPHLTGMDALQPNLILQKISSVLKEQVTSETRGGAPWDQRVAVHIFSAIEVACLDITGKALGCRLSDLLGGTMRERVPFGAYLFYKFRGAGGELGFQLDPEAHGWDAGRQAEALETRDLISQAKAMCAAYGFKSIKVKGGYFPPEKEVEDMLAIRREFGEEFPLRYDPNAIWSLETGLRWAPLFKGVLEYLEDPVRGQENMSILRSEVGIPLATNMCTTSFADLPGSIRSRSEDIILSDHHFWGGLRASMELYRICRTFGRGFSMHSNSHLGVSLAAMVHLGAALPEFEYEFDTHYPWQKDEVIKGGKLKFEDGMVTVPDGPGLGVEIDPVQLEKLHGYYLSCGLTKRDDEAEMQKLDPAWKVADTRF